MRAQPLPRLDYIDVEKRQRVLDTYRSMCQETLAKICAEPEKLPQTRHSSLASEYGGVAFLSYALGYPLEDVRSALADHARTLAKVFELRGHEDAFPAYVLTYDPAKQPSDPDSHTLAPMHPPGTKDYSLTNSRKGFLGVCAALTGGEDEVASRLASLIWDPPDASYIGRRSETCTPNDQRLAYALRELFAGNDDGVLTELKGVRAGMKESYDTDQATMIRSLITRDAAAFRNAIDSYLDWHRRRAVDKRNIDAVDFYLCVRGLGLCRLALQRGVCVMDDFTPDSVFLPLELIQ